MAGYYDRDRNRRKADGTYNAISDQTAAGTMSHPYTHHGNVAEYQASGIPFVMQVALTGGQKKKVEFPFVTQWIMIQTNQADVYVAFSSDGQQGSGVTGGANNFFTVQTLTNESPGSMPLLRLKCKEIFLKDPAGGCTVTIIAGLTNVPSRDFPDISEIVGVGRDATVTTL